ncbi:hypothetical protein J3E69DRAFT_359883 [Trichoderma sp. SZMC 28015]
MNHAKNSTHFIILRLLSNQAGFCHTCREAALFLVQFELKYGRKSQITTAAMCVHFRSWNRCSSCFLTFNRRCNRVPCWNGSLSRWRIHRHGLSCRSGCYERADDEVYTHLSCESCNMEAEAANCAEGKADVMEARVLRGMMGNRATMKRRADISGVLMRLWSFREVLRVRGNSKRGKRHLRMRIRMM